MCLEEFEKNCSQDCFSEEKRNVLGLERTMYATDRPVLTEEPLLTSGNDLVRLLIPKIVKKLKNPELGLELVHNTPNHLIYRVQKGLDQSSMYKRLVDFISSDLTCSSYCGASDRISSKYEFYGTGMTFIVSEGTRGVLLEIKTKD